MSLSGSSWLKFGLFTVGLGQSFVFVLVPPLARDLGLTEIQTSSIFAISAVAWALTSAFWGRASDKYGRRNIAILGLLGYGISLIALITPLFLAKNNGVINAINEIPYPSNPRIAIFLLPYLSLALPQKALVNAHATAEIAKIDEV